MIETKLYFPTQVTDPEEVPAGSCYHPEFRDREGRREHSDFALHPCRVETATGCTFIIRDENTIALRASIDPLSNTATFRPDKKGVVPRTFISFNSKAHNYDL